MDLSFSLGTIGSTTASVTLQSPLSSLTTVGEPGEPTTIVLASWPTVTKEDPTALQTSASVSSEIGPSHTSDSSSLSSNSIFVDSLIPIPDIPPLISALIAGSAISIILGSILPATIEAMAVSPGGRAELSTVFLPASNIPINAFLASTIPLVKS